MARSAIQLLLWAALGLSAQAALAQCPAQLPVQGAPPPAPLPVFPADNWWNLDIRTAPVDANSTSYIAFINNGGTRRLHPDFGGEESPGSVAIYGMPYAVVDGTQPKQAVTFQYWDESDGVDINTGQGLPFYPIPEQAKTQTHWVEGGAEASVDQRSQNDRHLLMVDCSNRHLYELYNVYFNASQGKWYAGSGAFFDLNANHRRPDGWTSADAAGLAIFPGLVRYDDAANTTITDLGHALRVTVRATNGYVYPASHRAGSMAGALPMGARLRLKASVGGLDPAMRASDPASQKIFRAMQKYGLIVADNGSDMYITGSFDLRWNNGVLNPAFATLSASDFDVVQLGWNPPPPGTTLLSAVSASPNPVPGGNAATGTVTLTSAASAAGVLVNLSSANPAATMPASVSVPAGAGSANFAIATSVVSVSTVGTLSASYDGVTRTTTFAVNPVPAAALSSLSLNPGTVFGGTSSTGTVTLTQAAPAGGLSVALASSKPAVANVPASVLVPAGSNSASFTISTSITRKNASSVISASYSGVVRTATLAVKRR